MAPGGNFDAGEDDLAVALLAQAARLRHGLLQRQRAHRPAGVGDDAVGAEVDAAVLHLEHGAGAARLSPGGEHLEVAAAQRFIHKDAGAAVGSGLLEQVEELHPLAGAADEVDAETLGLVGVGLDIAAAGGDDRAGIAPLGAADHLAGLLVADGGDGAGVDDIGVGRVLKRDERMAAARQLLLHGLRLILVDLAAEGIDGNSHGNSPRKGPAQRAGPEIIKIQSYYTEKTAAPQVRRGVERKLSQKGNALLG